MNQYLKHRDPSKAILRITGNKIDGDILIDKKNVRKLRNHSWYIKEDRTSANRQGYAAAHINNKTVRLHRFLLNTKDEELVDHYDRDRYNNCEFNLRKVTRSENNLNHPKRITNTSGRTGVRYSKGVGVRSDRWEAQVVINGKKKTKTFSIKLYGYDKAYEMAVAYREKWEDENDILTEK